MGRLSVVTSAIVPCDTICPRAARRHPDLLQQLSLLQWQPINLTGDCYGPIGPAP